MLKRYQMISIVYGGSGAMYANELRDMISQRSEVERYPISARIVMESVLTGDLLQSITGLFTQTSFCVAVLTADDCCCNGDKNTKRIRQNVIFELGMAIYRLGREKCILLSDFDPQDPSVELPSDLKGMDIKYFTQENRTEVFGAVLDKILQLSSQDNDGELPHYDNLLLRRDYFVNYGELFAACSHLGVKEGTAYLKGVLQYWAAECESFTHYEERCLYFLERIAFLPMFGRHSWVDEWLLGIEQLLSQFKPTDISYCGKRKLSFLRNLAKTVSAMMRLKLESQKKADARKYTELLEELTIEPAEDSGVTNPLALTVYYDYLGLLHMYLYDLDEGESHLEEAIACFDRILENYAEHTDLTMGIWAGFVGYNLARCYLKRYSAHRNADDALHAQKLMLRASIVRKGWLTVREFHPSIRSALSYEYFICKIEQISAMKLLGGSDDEKIRQEFKRLEGELESYMIRDEQLERLCFVQELLLRRQKDIAEENALAEEDL